jgi:queuine tRNA-ribosyltransferase
MRVQGLLGSDIAMQLDVCPPAGATPAELELAVQRTTRWAERCLSSRRAGQALFGIVQGGTDVALRRAHASELERLPLDGLALGGFSVGEPPAAMHHAVREVAPALDPTRPRYLMGVGTPGDLVRTIGSGIDLFDCVLPTRNARNGQVFTWTGTLGIRNARHREDPRPIDAECGCIACAGGFSRAYLRHLFMAREILAHRLLSAHNVFFYQAVVAEARRAVVRGRYAEWASSKLDRLGPSVDATIDDDDAP